MSHLCPTCAKNGLTAVAKIAAPREKEADRVIHFLLCDHCGMQALAIAGESGPDTAGQKGYILDKATWADLHLDWAGCPDPMEKSCQCPAHLKMSRFDPRREEDFLLPPPVSTLAVDGTGDHRRSQEDNPLFCAAAGTHHNRQS